MKSIIKKVLMQTFPKQVTRFRAYNRLIKNKNSYLYSTGWMQSLSLEKATNQIGHPIPWMNYPIIKILEERLSQSLNLFEYGSGYSTLFYANRVGAVASVEYDESWFNYVKTRMPQNVTLIFKQNDIDGDYCRVIHTTEQLYDVVIVDGRDRVNCIKQALDALSPSGVILLDDSQRDHYQVGIDYAKKSGFKALNIEGLKPTGHEVDRTTIFYREGNCLGL